MLSFLTNITLSQCAAEAYWFYNLLVKINVLKDCQNSMITLNKENQSAIRISKSCEQPKCLKHINVRYHFVKKKVKGTL